jgi:hypothetical protein
MTMALDFAPIVARLEGLKLFTSVGSSLEYAGLKNLPGRLPVAFAVSDSEQAAPNKMGTQIVDQKVTEIFAIVLIVSGNVRAMSGKGMAVSSELDELKRAVKEAFVGWKHPDSNAPVELVDGRLLSVDGTALTYALRFRATYHIRSAIQ